MQKRLDRARRAAKGNDADREDAWSRVCERLEKLLDAGKRASRGRAPTNERRSQAALRELQLITQKPLFYVCNVKEDQLGQRSTAIRWCQQVRDVAEPRARAGRRDLRGDRGRDHAAAGRRARATSWTRSASSEPGLNKVIRTRLRDARPDHVLHRRQEGSARLDDQARHQGAAGAPARSTPTSSAASSAPRSSGGKIACTLKTEAACRVRRQDLRTEGKEYVVRDGDVMHFRFNV